MDTARSKRDETLSVPEAEERKPFGPVAAAFFAVGIGSVVLGILTTLAEASESWKSRLEWSKSVGALSGKTIVAALAWAVSWAILHTVYKRRDPEPRMVFWVTTVLIAIGIVLTFPTFFQMFAPEE